MSIRRGRGRPRVYRQEEPILDKVSVPTLGSESGIDLRHEVSEMRGMLVGLMRVVDTLVTNQARQLPVPQEVTGSGGDPIVAPTAPVVAADTGSQLLKDFMAFRPPTFHRGKDAGVAENWTLSIEKHLRSIGCADDR